MTEKTWKTSYGNSDCHQQMIAEIVLEYFNELGAKILKAREDGVRLAEYVDFNPAYVNNMRRLGMSTTHLSGNSGGSKESKELFGKSNIGCYSYIEKVYRILCEECKGTMEYIDLEHDMIKQVRLAESKMDTEIPEENNLTYRDLYTLMQFAKRDQVGIHVISEGDDEIEDLALHIYDNKRQVNVCLKDMHDVWSSQMNFVFVPEDNIVKIHIVDDNGVADYQNYYQHNMDDELEPLEDIDGLVAYTGEPGDTTLDNIAFNYIRSIIILAIESQENKKDPVTNIKPSLTFKNLYNFIQVAERDEFGYYKISKDTALHIYDNKLQVNVCEMDGFNGWMSMMNLIFRPDQNAVTVYTVKNGIADYGMNDWKVSMDAKISHLKTTPEMIDGERVKEIILNIL